MFDGLMLFCIQKWISVPIFIEIDWEILELVNIFKRCDFDHPTARRSECSNPNSDDFMLFGMQKWAYGPIFMKIGEKKME